MPGIGAEAPVAGLMVLKWGRTEGASSFGSIPVATCKGMTDRDRAKPFCRVRTLSPLNRMQFSLQILPPSGRRQTTETISKGCYFWRIPRFQCAIALLPP